MTASSAEDHQFELLRQAHFRFLNRTNNFNGNIGWVADETAYVSKTRGGIVVTKRISPRKYDHVISARNY